MQTLVITKGLPACGKTTWALAEQQRLLEKGLTAVIVCKDDIRAELEKTGWTWSRENEKDVISKRNKLIVQAFQNKADYVISADTNFGHHEAALKGLAKACKARVEIMDFTHVSVNTCVERDAKREKPVGEAVIRQMHSKYVSAFPDFVPVDSDDAKIPAVICDLDGTLAIHSGRSPYEFGKCETDKLNGIVADTLRLYVHSGGYTPLYVSGRDEWCRPMTIAWLARYSLWFPKSQLFMRRDYDKRADDIVKYDIFNMYIHPTYNVKVVLDDRDRVVKMWRKIGLTCFQVAEGNF